jgi:predicted RNA binding protein YcfA (HicA-like mRNA interferase family)
VVTYDEAEKVLLLLGFKLRVKGSHHVFFKDGYLKNVSIITPLSKQVAFGTRQSPGIELSSVGVVLSNTTSTFDNSIAGAFAVLQKSPVCLAE